MYFILFYDLVDDYLERRTPFREEHLKLARDAVARGEIFAGGALADPADTDVIIFKGDDPSVAGVTLDNLLTTYYFRRATQPVSIVDVKVPQNLRVAWYSSAFRIESIT